MAFVTLYAQRPTGKVESFADVPGAFGGALHIWASLLAEYGYIPASGPLQNIALGAALMDLDDEDNALNKLWRDLPEIYAKNERDGWVLGLTFDRILIERQYLAQVAAHLLSFHRDHPTRWETLPSMARELTRASEDPEVIAIGFRHTSVADTFWEVQDPAEDQDALEDCDEDEWRPYDTTRDTGHWYLTPEAMKAKAAQV